MSHGPCEACEELLQGYLDRELTDAEVPSPNRTSTGATTAAGGTASRCRLRRYVQTTAVERMPAGVMEKLTQLRSAGA